MKINSL